MEEEVLKDAFRDFDKVVACFEVSMAPANAQDCLKRWAELKVAIVQGLETQPEPVIAWPAVERTLAYLEAAGAPSPLRWTREKPKRAGWYWYRNQGNLNIGDVFMAVWGFVANLNGSGHPVSVKDLDGEWAGPLPEPSGTPSEKGAV